MGMLTHELTQLRNEIVALRSARQELIQDLERETEGRRADVSQRLARFSKGFAAIAKRAKADRCGSLLGLKHSVSTLLTGVRLDLRGVRQAWLALGTPSPGAMEELGTRVRLETVAEGQGGQSQTGGATPRVPVGGQKPLRKKRKH
jgi:hypothetical protein